MDRQALTSIFFKIKYKIVIFFFFSIKLVFYLDFEHFLLMLVLLLPLWKHKQPPEMFYKKDVLKDFATFTGKRLCKSLFLNKVVDLSLWNLQIFKNFFFTEHIRESASVIFIFTILQTSHFIISKVLCYQS